MRWTPKESGDMRNRRGFLFLPRTLPIVRDGMVMPNVRETRWLCWAEWAEQYRFLWYEAMWQGLYWIDEDLTHE